MLEICCACVPNSVGIDFEKLFMYGISGLTMMMNFALVLIVMLRLVVETILLLISLCLCTWYGV